MPQEEDRIRTIAGYLLKNNARLILRAPPEVLSFVKASVLQAFTDPSVMVRNAAGQDIVQFLGILEPRNWPECLQQLVNTLDSTVTEHQEVCFSCIIVCVSRSRVSPDALRPIGPVFAFNTTADLILSSRRRSMS
jgi:transportin-1